MTRPLVPQFPEPCEASWVWQRVPTRRIRVFELDVVIFSAAISACEKSGRWLLALSFLQSMCRRRVSPNEVRCFRSTGRARFHGGTLLRPVFEQMQYLPDILRSFQPLTCAIMCLWQPSPELLTVASHRFQVTFGAAVAACEKAGEWTLAMTLLAAAGHWGVQRGAE